MPTKRALWLLKIISQTRPADAGFSNSRGASSATFTRPIVAVLIDPREGKMSDPQPPFDSRLSVPRRRFLKGAAAVGVIGAFPAIITRRALAEGNPTVY